MESVLKQCHILIKKVLYVICTRDKCQGLFDENSNHNVWVFKTLTLQLLYIYRPVRGSSAGKYMSVKQNIQKDRQKFMSLMQFKSYSFIVEC